MAIQYKQYIYLTQLKKDPKLLISMIHVWFLALCNSITRTQHFRAPKITIAGHIQYLPDLDFLKA
jgi:hypothetical protein